MRDVRGRFVHVTRQLDDAVHATQEAQAARCQNAVCALLRVTPRGAVGAAITTWAITSSILRLDSVLSRLSAALQPLTGLTALTGPRSSPRSALT